MRKYVLVNVIDREIYVYSYDDIDNAWNRVVKEFKEFCNNNDLVVGHDCNISRNTFSAWANGFYSCVDWQVSFID